MLIIFSNANAVRRASALIASKFSTELVMTTFKISVVQPTIKIQKRGESNMVLVGVGRWITLH